MHITEATTSNPGYIALVSVEFIEKGINYALKNPEYVHISYYKGENTVNINYDNFPYFGHSYILQKDTFMSFEIKSTTGIRIKTCHKNNAKINYTVSKGTTNIKTGTIDVNSSDELDFPIIINQLARDDYSFKFSIVDGSFDLEYILYEI